MKNAKSENIDVLLLNGLMVGGVATQALDLIGSLIYENEDAATYRADVLPKILIKEDIQYLRP